MLSAAFAIICVFNIALTYARTEHNVMQMLMFQWFRAVTVPIWTGSGEDNKRGTQNLIFVGN